MEMRHGRDILASTSPALLDVASIHAYISRTSYWGRNMPRALVDTAVRNSLCVGIYDVRVPAAPKQVGFGRWITDRATFAYMSDVYIEDAYQGRGLGKFLVECLMKVPEVGALRRLMLVTGDAEELYQRYAGFTECGKGKGGLTFMEKVRTAEELWGKPDPGQDEVPEEGAEEDKEAPGEEER